MDKVGTTPDRVGTTPDRVGTTPDKAGPPLDKVGPPLDKANTYSGLTRQRWHKGIKRKGIGNNSATTCCSLPRSRPLHHHSTKPHPHNSTKHLHHCHHRHNRQPAVPLMTAAEFMAFQAYLKEAQHRGG